MNLAQLRALRAVEEAGSVTGAAALLEVTQSAVSHALTSLESELGLRLVIRERSGCFLTESGRRLLPHALAALWHVDRFAEEAAAASGLATGRLRMGAFPSACQLLPRLIRAFGRRYPAVDVVVLEGTDDEVGSWLADRVIEIGVVTGPRDDLETVPLADDELLAVLPADHPLAGEPDVALTELADDPFILSSGGCAGMIARLYEEQELSLRPAHRVREVATILAMVREDLGVSLIPSLALNAGLDSTVALPLRPVVRRHLLLAALSRDALSPAARAFLDTVEEDTVGAESGDARLTTAAR
jgi:DNA-binding transcriptional LysR family regulator